jgi:hypothetical protein
MKATPGIAVVALCVLVGVGVASSLEAEAGSGKQALKTRIELSSVLLNSSGQ